MSLADPVGPVGLAALLVFGLLSVLPLTLLAAVRMRWSSDSIPRTRSRVFSAARATLSCLAAWPIAAAASLIFFCSASRFEPIVSSIATRVLRLRAWTGHRALGVVDHFPDPLVADAAGGVVEFASGVLFVLADIVGELLELLLQVGDLGVHRVLALTDRLRLGVARGAFTGLFEAR